MAAAIVGMLLSAWAVNGELALPPVVVLGVAALVAVVIGVRMYTVGVVETVRPIVTNPMTMPRRRSPAEGSAPG